MTSDEFTFNPDWATPPGDTISELLEERNWTQICLAGKLGYTAQQMGELINGDAPISQETAIKLERVLGGTARFWLSREAQYRNRLAQLRGEYQETP